MPLLKPQVDPKEIKKLLRQGSSEKKTKEEIQALLEDNGLGLEDIFDAVGSIMRGADTSASRLQAAKLAAEMNGLLKKDEIQNVPIVNIVIRDSQSLDINPILFPRSNSLE